MMKNLLAIILLLISFLTAQAQHTIKGIMTPAPKSEWVILYKIEGAKQVFIQNTTIKKDSVSADGNTLVVGNFQFTLPENTKKGTYRATYKLEGDGFVDFIYNKEDVSFNFNPNNPFKTLSFSESKDNILYTKYQSEIGNAQQKLDSIQFLVFKNPDLNLKRKYKKAYSKVKNIQEKYAAASKGRYIEPLVKATAKNNAPEIMTSADNYMAKVSDTFFDKIDFSDKTLLNSSFLVYKITDYIFYLNGSEDKKTQQDLYKKSIKNVFSKITNAPFKKDLLEFLISQFEGMKNVEIVDVLFNSYYNTLPTSLQNQKFKTEKLALLAAEIGRIAPDFSWEEDGETLRLSELNKAENYVLVFWSTTCSHCLKEIPKLHAFLKGNTKVKVIAFAMEKDVLGFDEYQKALFGWHNVLGLGKWENETARTYNINSTPNYFILDADKKIIAKPVPLEELKDLIDKL